MATELAELSPPQGQVVTHVEGPLLLLGGAGTGKTETIVQRFAALVERGVAPESVLVLLQTRRAADALRVRLEDTLLGGYEELRVHTAPDFCERLLREEALPAGLDPFFVGATQADRVAMLLDRVDELTLARHDFHGRPSALMASFVERIDRLKDELIGARDYQAWAAQDGREADLEFAKLYEDHDRMLAEQGALDARETLMRACALLRERADVLERVLRAPAARARRRLPGREPGPGDARRPARRRAREPARRGQR